MNRELFDLVAEVRAQWLAGAYTRAELPFSLDDAETWPRDFAALDAQFGERAAIDLPAEMRRPLAGRRLDQDGMIEGIPERFWPEEAR